MDEHPLGDLPSVSDLPTRKIPSELTTKMLAAIPAKRDPRLAILYTVRDWIRTHLILFIIGMLVITLVPVSVLGLTTYQHTKALALDGVQQLEAIKAQLPTSIDQANSLLDAHTFATMQKSITRAQNDFAELSDTLDHNPLLALAGSLPGLNSKIAAARHLAKIGGDFTYMATIAFQMVDQVKAIMHRSQKGPLLTQVDLNAFRSELDGFDPLLRDLSAQYGSGDFAGLLTKSQSALLHNVFANLPRISSGLTTARQLLTIAPNILGLHGPVTFLLVAMDRSELRAGGGFQGNYATLTLNGGRVASPPQLNDVYLLDKKDEGCWNAASNVPTAYESWWPFSCWGIRDANISADFPTTAQTTLKLYLAESGKTADGMVALTPRIIQQALDITGPISIAYGYNVTVSSQNLEKIIHQFQENYTGGDNSGLPPSDQLSSSRKRFTALLGRTLQDRFGHLTQSQQIKLAKNAFDDLATKDIQVYAKDASTAQFLHDQHLDHALQRGLADGVAVGDTNLSGKQNTFVQESLAESVVLTSSGAAQHTLTITYQFVNPHHEPTYGYFPGYRDYLRVYIPPQSTNWHSNTTAITHLTSDEPQRAMWGGFVVVQENASPVKITLQWQVPTGAPAGQPFTTFVQSQAGNHVQLQIAITKAGANKPAFQYATPANAIFDQDRTFTVR